MMLKQKPEMCGNDSMASTKGHRKSRRDQNGGACWLLAGFSNVWKGRDKLRKELPNFQAGLEGTEKAQGSRILQGWKG